jgi:hypothetical protein
VFPVEGFVLLVLVIATFGLLDLAALAFGSESRRPFDARQGILG